MTPKKPENLKEALVEEAFAIIEEKGVEQLSLRDVARRLGVSHQAPYKHFPSRDHILAAIVARCFFNFAAHLRARPRAQTPAEDLMNMGLAYLAFAQTSPLQYRLMFNTPLPPVADHPEMLSNSQAAFSLLHERLKTMDLAALPDKVDDPEKHDAVFIWSALHGLASLMQADAIGTIGLSEDDRRIATSRLFQRLSLALDP